jgi:hypothetical protein
MSTPNLNISTNCWIACSRTPGEPRAARIWRRSVRIRVPLDTDGSLFYTAIARLCAQKLMRLDAHRSTARRLPSMQSARASSYSDLALLICRKLEP